jgi:hypothetical protein
MTLLISARFNAGVNKLLVLAFDARMSAVGSEASTFRNRNPTAKMLLLRALLLLDTKIKSHRASSPCELEAKSSL